MPILTNQARQIQMHWHLTDWTSKKALLIFKNTKFGHKSSLTQKKSTHLKSLRAAGFLP
jgi:hypothetical protein